MVKADDVSTPPAPVGLPEEVSHFKPSLMIIKKKSIKEMKLILQNMEDLDAEEQQSASVLDGYLQNALDLCHKLLQRGYTEEKSSHIVNYCKMKLEFAQKQVANGDLEEGLTFAKTVLTFYLREAHAESTYLNDQED